jgi:NDP-sugar pyrophosphorylase family protein
MNAMILCAGYGTRLHPLTDALPKPLVEIAGFTLLDDILAHLAIQGVTRAVVNGSWLSSMLREHLGRRTSPPATVFQHEEQPLGTAGAVRRALPLLGERFLVVYGDNLTRQPLAPLTALHEALGAEVTISLAPTGDPSSKGIVLTDPLGRVTSFREKPPAELAGSNLASSGMLLCEASCVAALADGVFSDFGLDVLPSMLSAGRMVAAETTGGYTIDIGTLESYLLACHHVLSGRVIPLAGREIPADGRLLESPVPSDVTLSGTAWIGKLARVGSGSRLENCVVLEGAEVGRNCLLRNALILPGRVVPDGTEADDKYLSVF